MIPLTKNVVYIEINQGDFFGEIDIVFESQEKMISVDHMIQNLSQVTFNMQRYFTIQAIQNCTLLSLSLLNLQRMQR